MAKRALDQQIGEVGSKRGVGIGRNVGGTIETWAEDMGRILGTARAKADSWLQQREDIVKSLTGIRDTASNLLTRLGDTSQRAARRGRVVFRAAAANVTDTTGAVPKKKRRRMSKAARAKIAAAQRARWARQKAAMKK